MSRATAAAGIVHDRASREQKAAKIAAVLAHALSVDWSALRCLDVGCGSGLIANALFTRFRLMVGLEYDATSLSMIDGSGTAAPAFVRGDAEHLPFAAESLDIVICAQVYEHVAHADALAAEIHRVLTREGVCFFSGPNRLDPIERHHRLPFLSWLPWRWADTYVRLMGLGERYAERPRTFWGLRWLWRAFQIEDYTLRIIRQPAVYHCEEEMGALIWVGSLPRWALRLARPFYPNYNWVLRKRVGPGR